MLELISKELIEIHKCQVYPNKFDRLNFNHKQLFPCLTRIISLGVLVIFVIPTTYWSNSSQFIQSMIPLMKSNQKWIFCDVM